MSSQVVGIDRDADIVAIMGGTNDAAGGASGSVIYDRLQSLVRQIQAQAPAAKIVITPPPISAQPWNRALTDLRAKLPSITGARVGIQNLKLTDLSSDGVHPKNYIGLAETIGHNINLVVQPSTPWLLALGAVALGYYFIRR
jgi:lysophospholipase L1-like esterase